MLAGPRRSAQLSALWVFLLCSFQSLGTGRRTFLKHDVRRTKIKLVDGPSEYSGHVMVYHRGEWGMICDDGWDIFSAKVVCRMLGFETALTHTSEASFGIPKTSTIWIDNIRCYGTEEDIASCEYHDWGIHNCQAREAAGVYCSPKRIKTTPAPTITTTTKTTPKPVPRYAAAGDRNVLIIRDAPSTEVKALLKEVRLADGRFPEEGRVEVKIGNEWGSICAERWTLMEAKVVCHQLGMGYAKNAFKAPFYGGTDVNKVIGDVRCEGHEEELSSCFIGHILGDVICPQQNLIAGVICTDKLPDLVPNATMLETSTYLQDVRMQDIECALEENCAATSAYYLIRETRNWRHHVRRLLRFSSSVLNNGTADFHPFIAKHQWEWHLCHMHFHSMEVFAHYDLLDSHGNRIAEGHKASFCLEDVVCEEGYKKKYQCIGYGDQGISVGCSDQYLHNIDCQWIDITDLKPGNYTFRVHINPQNMVAEINYDNNAVRCILSYTGSTAIATNCRNTRD